MGKLTTEKLAVLILARLSVRSTRSPSPVQLSRALHALVSARASERVWREAFEAALSSLRAAALVEPSRLALTSAGRARLKGALRLKSAPRAKSWREFKSRYLPRLLFERVPAGEPLDPRLVVLADRLSVSLRRDSTFATLIDDWLARELGVSGKLGPSQLRAALLARELGLAPGRTPAATRRQAIAVLSGAPRATTEAVLAALATRWLFEGTGSLDGPSGGARAGAADADLPASSTRRSSGHEPLLRHLVEQVKAASVGPGARCFGPNKVFIASVWEALARDPELGALGEAGFKAALVEAHRRGAITLSRADLVAAMSPSDVAASETRHQNATYHFIVRGASA
jgi:hypothetical protein